MNGPYREASAMLMCPRCGELLERAFDDILACFRCNGIFITPPTAGVAFGDPGWPKDTSAMWWKSSLECPICAHAGATTIMAAQTFEGTQIDRCAAHGLWLDAGELSRLLRTRGDELALLRSKLHGEGVDGNELDSKREQWRRDVEARRKAAEEHDAWLAAERARQIEAADRRHREEQRAAEEQQRIAAALTRGARAPSTALFDPPLRVEPPPPPPPRVERPPPAPLPAAPVLLAKPPPPAMVLTSRERDERRERVEERRSLLVRAIGELETQLIEARTTVRELEAKLAAERVRLRALLDDDR